MESVFQGYAKHKIGYSFLVMKSDIPDVKVGTIMVSKDATFFEDIFSMRDMQSTFRLKFNETCEPVILVE